MSHKTRPFKIFAVGDLVLSIEETGIGNTISMNRSTLVRLQHRHRQLRSKTHRHHTRTLVKKTARWGFPKRDSWSPPNHCWLLLLIHWNAYQARDEGFKCPSNILQFSHDARPIRDDSKAQLSWLSPFSTRYSYSSIGERPENRRARL